MVSLHFLEKRLNHDFLSMLAPAVHEVARAALFEVAVEDQVDGAMNQVRTSGPCGFMLIRIPLSPPAPPPSRESPKLVRQVMCRELAAVVRETVQELAHNVQHEKAVVERRQVARAAERIAWTSSLRVLMETLSTNGTGLFLQDHIHRMAVQLMAKRTFGLMQELESSQRELVDSPPMHEFHGMLAAGPGFNSMLLQLDEALAENEAHIHRSETHT